MSRTFMVDALVVMLETMKLLLFGFAMLFVLTLFLTLMVIIANLHIHLGYQILAMVSLLLLFTGVIIQLMVCANKDNDDNNSDINNNNRSNNSSDNHHRVVQITIEDPPPPYFPNSIMNHAFCVESHEEMDSSEASSECGDISPDGDQNTEYGDHLNPMDYYADGIIDDELCDLDLFDGPFIDSEIRFCDTVYDDGDGSSIGCDDKYDDDCVFNKDDEILI